MGTKLSEKKAISFINKHGMLLTFPIKNAKLPLSLWSLFFPKTKMKWEWSDEGDDHVVQMWHLMKKLSENKSVVYSKWYQGRSTFFSHSVFTAGLCLSFQDQVELSRTAKLILETLESDSPLSTKQLKRLTDLVGKDNEPAYNKAMKELFKKFLIVGFGEVDDGAFPSLAVGATKHIHEDLWNKAQEMDPAIAQKVF